MPILLVPMHEFNPCHNPGGSGVAGGRFCSEGIPGRSEVLVAASRAAVDAAADAPQDLDIPRRGTAASYLLPVTAADRERLTGALKAVLTQPEVGVVVMLPVEVLSQVMADGRLKNQFESKRSGGYFDADELEDVNYTRRQIEKTVMGVEPDFPGKDRPIYGVIEGVAGAPGNAPGYGDVAFDLKPSVNRRTTVTVGDSFGFGVLGMAEPMLQPTWRILLPAHRSRVLGYIDRSGPVPKEGVSEALHSIQPPYIEAQIHGGVSLSDVARIRVLNYDVNANGLAWHALESHGWHLTNPWNAHRDGKVPYGYEYIWERNP